MLKINIAEWTTRFHDMKRSLSAQARHGRPYSVALTTREIFNTAAEVLAGAEKMSYAMKPPKPDQASGYVVFKDRDMGLSFLLAMKAKGVEAILFRSDERKPESDWQSDEYGYYPHTRPISSKFLFAVMRSGPYSVGYETSGVDGRIVRMFVRTNPRILIELLIAPPSVG